MGVADWQVSVSTREAFERLESQRVDVLVAQFRQEFARRRAEIARAVKRIADSDLATTIAIAPDYGEYVSEAAQLAATHGLDLLELVAADGTIISSAEWPARFGYKEEWLTTGAGLGLAGRVSEARGASGRRHALAGGGGHRAMWRIARCTWSADSSSTRISSPRW